MQRSILLLPIVLILNSCGSKETKLETSTASCLCDAYSNPDKPFGERQQRAFDALDQYLIDHHFLNGNTVDAYKTFAADNSDVIIPANTDSIALLELALYGGQTGAPDTRALGDCIDSMYNNSRQLDPNSFEYRFGKDLHSFATAGAPDGVALTNSVLSYATDADVQTTFFRDMFYLFMSHRVKIEELPMSVIPVDPNSQSAPPPPPPPPADHNISAGH